MASRGKRIRPEDQSDSGLAGNARVPAISWGGPVFPRTPHSFPKYPDFRGRDLRGRDLQGYDMTGGDFGDANMEGMDLRHANFEGAYMKGVNLKNANLERANLSGTNLQDADLTRTDLKNAHIAHADLTGADFSGAYMKNAHLLGSVLKDTNFSGSETKGITSNWDKRNELSHDFARDMERLAKVEADIPKLEEEIQSYDEPGKRNSLSAKLTRGILRDSRQRATDLRFEWRHLLSEDPDSGNPGAIAKRVKAKLPPEPSLGERFKLNKIAAAMTARSNKGKASRQRSTTRRSKTTGMKSSPGRMPKVKIVNR